MPDEFEVYSEETIAAEAVFHGRCQCGIGGGCGGSGNGGMSMGIGWLRWWWNIVYFIDKTGVQFFSPVLYYQHISMNFTRKETKNQK